MMQGGGQFPGFEYRGQSAFADVFPQTVAGKEKSIAFPDGRAARFHFRLSLSAQCRVQSILIRMGLHLLFTDPPLQTHEFDHGMVNRAVNKTGIIETVQATVPNMRPMRLGCGEMQQHTGRARLNTTLSTNAINAFVGTFHSGDQKFPSRASPDGVELLSRHINHRLSSQCTPFVAAHAIGQHEQCCLGTGKNRDPILLLFAPANVAVTGRIPEYLTRHARPHRLSSVPERDRSTDTLPVLLSINTSATSLI